MTVSSITGVGGAAALDGAKAAASPATGPSFELSKTLGAGIGEVNQQLMQAQQVSQEFMTTGKHQLHEVMIKLEQADLSFRYLTQIRNKVIEAYNDIMRMQV